MFKKCFAALVAAVALVAAPNLASAGSTTVYLTGVNDQAGEPLNFSAVFTFSTNVLTVQLFNNQLDPKSAAQTIRGINFSLAGGINTLTAGSFTSSGTLITITGTAANQYSIAGSPTSPLTAWSGSVSSGLYTITESGPAQLIIGGPNPEGAGSADDRYASSNSSINNGGGPHNPHVYLSATFTLGIQGLTADSSLLFDATHNVTFLNGTSNESATSTSHTDTPPGGGGAGNPAPLPAAATGGMALMAALGIGARIRRRLRAA